jgi:hypothetical protein
MTAAATPTPMGSVPGFHSSPAARAAVGSRGTKGGAGRRRPVTGEPDHGIAT